MLTFATLLRDAGIDPASVRLLRHQDSRYPGFPTPYVLWRDHRERFEAYQATQSFANEASLRAPIWASFVGLPNRDTLFAGLYAATLIGPLPFDRPHPVTGEAERAGTINLYRLSILPELRDCDGRLLVAWGEGYRAWIQRGDGTPKPVVELRRQFQEPAFPGFSKLVLRLSEIESLPAGWASALASTKGVYLLTCADTKEQYVGIACGAGGFLTRWLDYAATGHGGNVALRARGLRDYQVSILETVGSATTEGELLALEALWKQKLQSREMGLNRN